MISNGKYILFTFCCLLLTSLASAQQKKLDSLKDEVIKEFNPTITDAVKINDNPGYADTTTRIPAQLYSISPKPMPTVFDVIPIKPARMQGEPLTQLYNAFVKLGIGNAGFENPGLFNNAVLNGELFYNSLRSKDYTWGTHYNFLNSPSEIPGYGNSSYSDNDFNLYGKRFYSTETLSANLDISRNVMHYYGYDMIPATLSEEQIRQRFLYISPALRFCSHYKDSTRFNYDGGFKYYNLQDLWKVNENSFKADVNMQGYYEKQLITGYASVDYYNTRNSVDTVTHTIVHVFPSIAFKTEKWKLNIGVDVVCDFSQVTTPNYYPTINFNYNVIGNMLIPYAGVDGGYDVNSYKSLSDVNPFISQSAVLMNSDRHEGYLGLRGTVDSKTSYNIKATYSIIDNMPFFVQDTSGTALQKQLNKFALVYDNVTYLNLHGEIGYQETEKLLLLGKLDYNHYQMSNELRPWYKPEVEVTLSAHYNLRDKFVIKGDLFFLGKQLAKTYVINDQAVPKVEIVPKELNGVTDVNLGLEYKYRKLMSFFLNFNNIAGFRYQRWNNYPTQGFFFMAGTAITF